MTAELAALRAAVGAIAQRQDLTAQDIAHIRTANDELRAVVAGPQADSHARRLTVAETRLDMADRPAHTPQDPLSTFWTAILSGVVAPFKAFAAARTGTQIITALVVLAALLVTTEGGRDLIRGWASTPGPVERPLNPPPAPPTTTEPTTTEP